MNTTADLLKGFPDPEKIHAAARVYAGQQSKSTLDKGYKQDALHVYTDEAGNPIYWKIRLKNPDTSDKWIRSFSQTATGFQFKEPDFKIVYPRGEGKKPLYNLYKLSNNPNDVVLIVEGESAADALTALGITATTSGGATSAGGADWQPLAGRKVRLWRDYDDAGVKYQDEVIAALSLIGCDVSIVDVDALGLQSNGDDAVNWLAMRGESITTADDVLALPIELRDQYARAGDTKSDTGENYSFTYGGGSYRLIANGEKAGVYFTKLDDDDKGNAPLWLCSPLRVIATTSDSKSSAWGRLLEWVDRANVMHKWAMPMELLAGDGGDIRRELLRQGVQMNSTKTARDRFIDYLQMTPTDNKALCVDRIGWHGSTFVLPDRTAGGGEQLTVFQNPHGLDPAFSQAGTLQDWTTHIAQPAIGNSRLMFALSLSFAGALLELANEESGGFHLRGSSSIGKSTALVLSSSVWGSPSKYRRQWRATTNGLEGLAVLHNDGLLVLDEISQCEPRDVGQSVYMLCNQQGKTRSNQKGGARIAATWRLLVLSSGEESLAAIMNQAGQRAKAGQENRLADIAADAGASMGLFERLHGTDSPSDFAKILNDAAAQYHGTAGMVWVDYLSNDRTACTKQVLTHIKEFNQHIPPAAQGQAMRVSRRFALVAAAGEMATAAGITGWQAGDATAAAVRCFNDWLATFGGIGNHEERAILAHVRAFIEAHGSSRFESMETDNSRERIANRVGYFRDTDQGKEYLAFPQMFKSEVCKGFDHKHVEKVLISHGVLKKNERGGGASVARIPDHTKQVRMYIFTDKVFMDDEQNTDSSLFSGNAGNGGNNVDSKGFEPVTSPKSEVVTAVTKAETDSLKANVTNSVTTVTSGINEVVTGAKPCNDSLVTSVTAVTSKKQSNDNQGSFFL